MNDRGFVVIALAACLLAAVGIITTAAVKNHGDDTAKGTSTQAVEKQESKKTD